MTRPVPLLLTRWWDQERYPARRTPVAGRRVVLVRKGQRESSPARARRPRVARADRTLDGPRRAPPGDLGRKCEVLCGLRPDGSEPAPGEPGPDPHRTPAAGRRPLAVR